MLLEKTHARQNARAREEKKAEKKETIRERAEEERKKRKEGSETDLRRDNAIMGGGIFQTSNFDEFGRSSNLGARYLKKKK
jgi:hypothetical protein